MPRPPPPHDALSMTGRPIAAAIFLTASMSSGSGSVAGTTGTPTSTARLRAATLLPSLRIVSGDGPMKMMPLAAQASANSGLSDSSP